MQWWSEYPYMMASLLLCAAAGVLLWLRPGQRQAMLLSGLLGTPFGLFSFEFVGHYWKPKVVAFFIASPEDLLFSFAVGVITWSLATAFLRRRLTINVIWPKFWRRYLGYALLGVGLGYAIKWTHPIGVMNSALVGMAATGIVLAWLRRDLWPLALSGTAWFGGFYLLLMLIGAAIWPGFIAQWKSEELLSVSLFGLPLYELFWALGYGLVWPLFAGHIMDARFVPCESSAALPSPQPVSEEA
jgi:hypothetical protein